MKFEGKLEGREMPSRASRIDVNYPVRVRCESGDFEARMMNLSASGFRLRSSEALAVGANITLQVARLTPVKAVVRWADGPEAGGVFLESMAL